MEIYTSTLSSGPILNTLESPGTESVPSREASGSSTTTNNTTTSIFHNYGNVTTSGKIQRFETVTKSSTITTTQVTLEVVFQWAHKHLTMTQFMAMFRHVEDKKMKLEIYT